MTTTVAEEDSRRRHLPRLPPIVPSADPIPLVRALLTASGCTAHLSLPMHTRLGWLPSRHSMANTLARSLTCHHESSLYAQDMRGPTPWSNYVIQGRVLAGAYPAVVNDDDTNSILRAILKTGVDAFVCLQAVCVWLCIGMGYGYVESWVAAHQPSTDQPTNRPRTNRAPNTSPYTSSSFVIFARNSTRRFRKCRGRAARP